MPMPEPIPVRIITEKKPGCSNRVLVIVIALAVIVIIYLYVTR